MYAPFSSIKSLSETKVKLIPKFLKQFFIKDSWNNLDKIRHLTNIKHIKFVHGTKDPVVAAEESNKLYQLTKQLGLSSERVEIEGGDHNTIKIAKEAKLNLSKPIHHSNT